MEGRSRTENQASVQTEVHLSLGFLLRRKRPQRQTLFSLISSQDIFYLKNEQVSGVYYSEI